MMDLAVLQDIWFFLFLLLIGGYAVLDGFDLGVGVLSLFNRDDRERRLYVNAVAPVWDGNEVWLLTAGGALFAAFPPVYATVFSGFYLALMLVLLGLIARAVSMEFRGRVESSQWRRVWDLAFGLGSFLPALLFGVAVGNILRGLPLTPAGEFAGTFFSLLNPFSLLVGVLGLVMFVTHGAFYLGLKTERDLRQRALAAASKGWYAWVLLYIVTTLYAFFEARHLFAGTVGNPVFWLFSLVFLGALLYMPVAIRSNRPLPGLVASGATILGMIGQAGSALYPNLVPALNPEATSLAISNASSTAPTLTTMLIIALVGMPVVLAYTIFIYRVFRGPVVIDEHSY